MTTDSIIAMGVPLGARTGLDTPEVDPSTAETDMSAVGVVRRAGEFVRLPFPIYELWQGRFFADFEDLQVWAAQVGLELDEADAQHLEEMRLLARIPITSDAALPRLADLRLIPAGLCYGNQSDDSSRFVLESPSGEPLTIGLPEYLVWAYSDNTSLADACARAAETLGVLVATVVDALFHTLPGLLRSGTAGVDWMP